METGQLVIKESKEFGLDKGDILKCNLGDGYFYNLRTKNRVDIHCNLGKFCKYVTDVTDEEIVKGYRLNESDKVSNTTRAW